jgi:hypothetical protein
MDVDKTGSDGQAIRAYDSPGSRAVEPIDGNDSAGRDANVLARARSPAPVNDIASGDQQVEVHD